MYALLFIYLCPVWILLSVCIHIFFVSPETSIHAFIWARRKKSHTHRKEKKEWVLEQNVKRRCWKKWCKLRQKKNGTKVTFNVGRKKCHGPALFYWLYQKGKCDSSRITSTDRCIWAREQMNAMNVLVVVTIA